MEMVWKDDVAYCGKVKVGSVWYNGMRPRGDEENIYKATAFMSGIKSDLGAFKTIDDAKKIVEVAFHRWIILLNSV